MNNRLSIRGREAERGFEHFMVSSSRNKKSIAKVPHLVFLEAIGSLHIQSGPFQTVPLWQGGQENHRCTECVNMVAS